MLVTAIHSAAPPDYVCQEPDYSAVCMYIETVAVDKAVIKKAQKSCFLVFASHPEIALPVPIAGVGWCEKSEAQRGKSLRFLYLLGASGCLQRDSAVFSMLEGNFLMKHVT